MAPKLGSSSFARAKCCWRGFAAALASQADVIASADKRDLWPMGSFQGIPILAPAEAVTLIGATGKT